MNEFEAYQKYVALKRHFISNTYDYFKFNKKTKASIKSFEKRKDIFFFKKLAKQPDPETYLLANIMHNKDFWIGDFEQGQSVYKKHIKKTEALTKVFEDDISQLYHYFPNNFICHSGNHPFLLNFVLGNKISLETLIILNDLVEFFSYWDEQIKEKIIWPSVKFKAEKYKPFMTYDKEKMKKITKNFFHNNEKEKEKINYNLPVKNEVMDIYNNVTQ